MAHSAPDIAAAMFGVSQSPEAKEAVQPLHAGYRIELTVASYVVSLMM